jgi:hypothetical protein
MGTGSQDGAGARAGKDELAAEQQGDLFAEPAEPSPDLFQVSAISALVGSGGGFSTRCFLSIALKILRVALYASGMVGGWQKDRNRVQAPSGRAQ